MAIYFTLTFSLINIILGHVAGQQIVDGGAVKWSSYDNDDGRCNFVAFYDHLSTWCISKSNQVFVQKNGKWMLVNGLKLKHITVGPAGIWGLDLSGKPYYRQGVSERKPEGLKWTGIDGSLSHLTSGPSGVLWGINYPSQNPLFRTSMSCNNPLGEFWSPVQSDKLAKHVSCSSLGCWVVTTTNTVHFVAGVNRNGQGSAWQDVPVKEVAGFLQSVDSSASGYRVVAVSVSGQVYMRNGISPKTPFGKEWLQLGNETYQHAVPCHMGYIATTSNSLVRFITRVPLCKKTFEHLDQIDTGKADSTCGVHKEIVYQKQGKTWVQMDGHLTHVSCTNHEMWGVDRYGSVNYRTGTSCFNHFGSAWVQVPGNFKQIDVAYFGLVYAVNKDDRVFCRMGITPKNPTGDRWAAVPGRHTYVSCGDVGCWSVNHVGAVFFRGGVSADHCQGVNGSVWKEVPGVKLKMIESGHHGLVFGVSEDGTGWMRLGTSDMNPIGTGWMPLYTNIKKITHGKLKIFTIDNSDVPQFCD